MKKLTYKDAPHDWAICFQNDCPLSDRCLRHAVAQLAPPTLTHHVTVLPAAREGDHCRLFATAEPVRIARGMKQMLAPGSTGTDSAIRHQLFGIFGSRTHYYRYRDGEYDITPEQQRKVLNVLRKYGFRSEEPFDHYTTQYYFPKP